jgi:Ca-activated chloride channel homolog
VREFQGCGLGITAMGVGDDFDEYLMEVIADEGGGNFHYIRKTEDIPVIFAKELEGLLSVVAQNAKLTLKGQPGLQIGHIYTVIVQI